jgi:hypothetical protein
MSGCRFIGAEAWWHRRGQPYRRSERVRCSHQMCARQGVLNCTPESRVQNLQTECLVIEATDELCGSSSVASGEHAGSAWVTIVLSRSMLAPRDRPCRRSGAGPVQSPMCCTPGDPQLHARSRSNFQAECLVIERLTSYMRIIQCFR